MYMCMYKLHVHVYVQVTCTCVCTSYMCMYKLHVQSYVYMYLLPLQSKIIYMYTIWQLHVVSLMFVYYIAHVHVHG